MTATFYVGDAIEVMGKLPENSVDLILTSPPFLALRSYLPQDHPDKALEGGSQSTPGEYVDWLLDVVEACARVLAPHGSLCFELGDTYSGAGGYGSPDSPNPAYGNGERFTERWEGRTAKRFKTKDDGWPLAKSLSLIPESFRWAMVYGHNPFTGRKTEPWRLRNVIRWVRPNPPVGALGDKFRPATSELMVFCKAKDRYFDLDAVREAVSSNSHGGGTWTTQGGELASVGTLPKTLSNPAGAPPLDWWNIPPGGYPGAHYAVWPPELLVKPIKAMCPEKVCRTCGEASRRIVNTRTGTNRQPAIAAHIRERRKVAGFTVNEVNGWFNYSTAIQHWESDRDDFGRIPTPADWSILKQRLGLSDDFDDVIHGGDLAEYEAHGDPERQHLEASASRHGWESSRAQGMAKGRATKILKDVGFSDCGHDDYRPGLVLDPFAGSGTTLAVATGHGRDAIGIDLDERNYELALDRVGPLILQRGTID